MVRLSHILFACAILASGSAQAQQFRWAKNGGSIDAGPISLTERVQNIATDVHGNTYITSPVYRNNITVAGATLPSGHDYQFTDRWD